MIAQFIASAASAMVTATLITNSTSINVTNKDAYFGSNNVAVYDFVDQLCDTSNNLITTVSNTGTYTVVSNGWGYQQVIGIPNNGSFFSSYVPGSLSYSLVTNIQNCTNILGTGGTESMFSSMDFVNTNFTPNPNFWLARAQEKTAAVIAHEQSGSVGGCAVTLRHVLNCAHAGFGVGQVLVFVDDNGASVLRTVIATVGVTNTDILASLLNADLPATIHPCMVLPPTFTNQMPLVASRIQLVGMTQNELWAPFIGYNFIFNTANPYIFISPNSIWVGVSYNVNIVSGDSGHPIGMMIGTNLVLVSHWYTGGSGNNYAALEPQINWALHYLSTNNAIGSDYQLTTKDLSSWPSY